MVAHKRGAELDDKLHHNLVPLRSTWSPFMEDPIARRSKRIKNSSHYITSSTAQPHSYAQAVANIEARIEFILEQLRDFEALIADLSARTNLQSQSH